MKSLNGIAQRALYLDEPCPQTHGPCVSCLDDIDPMLGTLRCEQDKKVYPLFNRARQDLWGFARIHNRLGNAQLQRGELSLALASYRRALAIYPYCADVYNNLGIALATLGNQDQAAVCFHRAITIQPSFTQAHKNHGDIQAELGLFIAAAASYRRALEIAPANEGVHFNLANSLLNLGELDQAIASYYQLLEINPDHADAHNNLGTALMCAGENDKAVPHFRQALESNPDHAGAHNNLGVVLMRIGGNDQAAASYRRALELNPDCADAHNNLGVVLACLGENEKAAACYHRALEINPAYAEAYNNLGFIQSKLGQLVDAVASCRRAVEINPNYVDAHNNLGIALMGLGENERAAACYHRALEINPAYAEAYNNLGFIQSKLGLLRDAAANYRRALTIHPHFFIAHSNLLLCLSHDEAIDPPALFAEHGQFGAQVEAQLSEAWSQNRPPYLHFKNPERCLQVGFVSADLRTHAVAYFIEPIFKLLAAHSQLCLHGYYNHPVEDLVTQRLRGYLQHWHAISSLSDDALAQKIREDHIDILIDLSGHTAGNRLLTFARKPAPIQVTWIGYPNTTGLQAMDYVLCDRFVAPLGLYEQFYVEKFARIPSSGTFAPEENSPPVNALPALKNGYVTFASFNRAIKLGDQVIATWSAVLRAVCGSCLVLANVSEEALVQQLIERFARYGIGAERLMFISNVPLYEYLALHHQVDIILDTWPYTGGTTTNHALWMGVPVITLKGPFRAQCQSAAVLERLELADWVAADVDEYVSIAVDWAHSLDELARLRLGMRERWHAAPFRQPETVAHGFEQALRLMWRRWCTGLPAAHFEIKPDAIFESLEPLCIMKPTSAVRDELVDPSVLKEPSTRVG
jgi:protein O-GlcNAc transferase